MTRRIAVAGAVFVLSVSLAPCQVSTSQRQQTRVSAPSALSGFDFPGGFSASGLRVSGVSASGFHAAFCSPSVRGIKCTASFFFELNTRHCTVPIGIACAAAIS